MRETVSRKAFMQMKGSNPRWAIEWVESLRRIRPELYQPTGYVYFVRGRKNGPVKIGFTRGDPASRMTELQVGNPDRLTIAAVLAGNRRLEADLHHIFDNFRLTGEWFRGNAYGLPELIEFANERLPV